MSEVETKDIVAELDAWIAQKCTINDLAVAPFPDEELHRLQRARDEIVAVRDQLTESANRYEEMLGDMNHEANAAKRDRAEARAEALEEVAQFIKQRGGWLTVAALIADIRALKDKP